MKFMDHRKKYFIGSWSRRVPESGIPLSLTALESTSLRDWRQSKQICSVSIPGCLASSSHVLGGLSWKGKDKNNPDSWYLPPPTMVEQGTF